MDHPISTLSQLFGAPRDLRALARALGEVCLAEMKEIDEHRQEDTALGGAARALAKAFAEVPVDWWLEDARAEDGYAEVLGRPAIVETSATLVDLHPPLACWAALYAICRGPLHLFFIDTFDRFTLRRGDPVPLPVRPTHTAFGATTPSFETLSRGTLLDGTGFRLYGGPVQRHVDVALDFSFRDTLDEHMWLGDKDGGRFPLVATIHPYGDADDLRIDHVTPTNVEVVAAKAAEAQAAAAALADGSTPEKPKRAVGKFFGVRPAAWDEDAVVDQIRTAADAGIAVLPELSLPAPDALGARIRRDHGALPKLVVAGSAHLQEVKGGGAGGERTVRSNAGEAYLEGVNLLSYRKIHPFRTKYLGPEWARWPRDEDLFGTPASITVIAGTLTRLAVVICADLNDDEVPDRLKDAAVNLLLVPSLTVAEGSFSGVLGTLASRGQGVSVIVNGTAAVDPEVPPAKGPFLAMVAIPVPAPDAQVTEHGPPPAGRRAVGMVDVQADPPPDVTWR